MLSSLYPRQHVQYNWMSAILQVCGRRLVSVRAAVATEVAEAPATVTSAGSKVRPQLAAPHISSCLARMYGHRPIASQWQFNKHNAAAEALAEQAELLDCMQTQLHVSRPSGCVHCSPSSCWLQQTQVLCCSSVASSPRLAVGGAQASLRPPCRRFQGSGYSHVLHCSAQQHKGLINLYGSTTRYKLCITCCRGRGCLQQHV